jgi:nitric oxide reductase activation protein
VPTQRTTPPYPPSTQTQEDEARTKMEREMEKRRNEDRQKQIKRDAEKLLQLATELKGYVDKSNENVLSMDVVKKADEIEKYARSVKEKMKAQ